MDIVRDVADQVSRVGSGLSASIQSLYDSAAAGHFMVSGEGGAPLLVTIARFKDWMKDQMVRLQNISQEPPLGQLEGGRVLAPLMADVATDADGYATRFDELRDVLTKAEDAINLAIVTYQRLEAEEKIRYLRGRQAYDAVVHDVFELGP